jgi:hypothetical protein
MSDTERRRRYITDVTSRSAAEEAAERGVDVARSRDARSTVLAGNAVLAGKRIVCKEHAVSARSTP